MASRVERKGKTQKGTYLYRGNGEPSRMVAKNQREGLVPAEKGGRQ